MLIFDNIVVLLFCRRKENNPNIFPSNNMATSSVIFRGPKKIQEITLDLTFIEHVPTEDKKLFEIISVDVTTQKELSRIYIDGDLVHQVVVSEEKRKYAGKSSSETPEAMNPKILQNVSIQLLIDALFFNDTVVQLAPLTSEGNGDGTVKVVLDNKPDNVVPFDLTTYTAATSSSSSSSSSESQDATAVMASLGNNSFSSHSHPNIPPYLCFYLNMIVQDASHTPYLYVFYSYTIVQDASSLDSAGDSVVDLSNQMASVSGILSYMHAFIHFFVLRHALLFVL